MHNRFFCTGVKLRYSGGYQHSHHKDQCYKNIPDLALKQESFQRCL